MSQQKIPNNFDDYKQSSADGACDLYAIIFGFIHTEFAKQLENNITIEPGPTHENFSLQFLRLHKYFSNRFLCFPSRLAEYR